MSDAKIAIVARWRKYGLPHVSCGFLDEADFRCFGRATLTFGDGSWVEIEDPADVILTNISWSAIDE